MDAGVWRHSLALGVGHELGVVGPGGRKGIDFHDVQLWNELGIPMQI